jgi:hypothetical protein
VKGESRTSWVVAVYRVRRGRDREISIARQRGKAEMRSKLTRPCGIRYTSRLFYQAVFSQRGTSKRSHG